MIDATDTVNEETAPAPARSDWWGPRTDNAAEPEAEPAASPPAVNDQPDVDETAPAATEQQPGGGSFWDRIEEATATENQPSAPPSPRRDTAANQTSVPSTGTEIDTPDDTTSTVLYAPPHQPVEPEPEQKQEQHHDETVVETTNDQPETGPGEESSTGPAPLGTPLPSNGESLLGGLNQVARILADARSDQDPAHTSQASELAAAIQDARDRPREIDAMLAISARLETISETLTANEHMARAIDRALQMLQGGDRGET